MAVSSIWIRLTRFDESPAQSQQSLDLLGSLLTCSACSCSCAETPESTPCLQPLDIQTLTMTPPAPIAFELVTTDISFIPFTTIYYRFYYIINNNSRFGNLLPFIPIITNGFLHSLPFFQFIPSVTGRTCT